MTESEINKRISERRYYTPDQFEEFANEIGDNFKLLKTNKKIEYYNIPCSFDIETSSLYLGKDKTKASIMYEWTLGINWIVMIGRTWEEFIDVTTRMVEHFQLNGDRRLIIYVHNLGFEFQAFRKWLDWKKVFSLDKRKPIQAITVDGIEFRCSYLLSGYSLQNLGNNLTKYKVKKMVGDLDYSLIRTPETELTDKEIGYCLNDVYVVMAYIQETMERLGNITKLPLTKTGYVRKYCRDSCYYSDKTHRKNIDKYKKYRQLMKSLTVTDKEYMMLKEAFQGGFTHANPFFSRGVFTNVSSYDFTSSYPSVMLSEKFPMSKGEWIEITDEDDFNKNLHDYCCVFDIKFNKIRSKKTFENYISTSHCRKMRNWLDNNGRLVSADSCEMTITELDFFIINYFYEWADCEIGAFIRYKKNYLPTDFVKAILKLYVDKTSLKGVEGKELDYLLSKEQLNSCYGMCVTDICRDEIVYDIDGWDSEKPDISLAIDKYNKSAKRFLFYPWGIWVTAYARFNLFTGICEFEDDYIYSDTDSIKVVNAEKHSQYFEDYNTILMRKLEDAMKYHKIDVSLLRPKNIKGEEKPIGVWDFEGIYSRFKTLGAKRYMTEKDGEISLTVSGLNKKVAVPYMLEKFGDKIFEAFDDELYIPPEHTGKMTHTYIDEEMFGIVTDHLNGRYAFHELSGTHLENCDYSLSINEKYLNYMLDIKEHLK